MPWTKTVTMQRLQFVAAYLEGDLPVAEVCRHFNISRKTVMIMIIVYDMVNLLMI